MQKMRSTSRIGLGFQKHTLRRTGLIHSPTPDSLCSILKFNRLFLHNFCQSPDTSSFIIYGVKFNE